jgi:hypothetical protein
VTLLRWLVRIFARRPRTEEIPFLSGSWVPEPPGPITWIGDAPKTCPCCGAPTYCGTNTPYTVKPGWPSEKVGVRFAYCTQCSWFKVGTREGHGE